jgi:hypothetical protein
MLQITLVGKRSLLGWSQQVFHLFHGQDWNKILDTCFLLKLVRCVAQKLFDFGYRTRKLFSEILHDTVPNRLLALEHGLPAHDSAERARIYREELIGSEVYRSLFSIAERRGLVVSNPAKKVPLPDPGNERDRVLTAEE